MRLATAILPAILVLTGCEGCREGGKESPSTTASEQATEESMEGAEDTEATAENESQLKIEDLKVGTGAEAVDGKTLQVHYVGTLTDGTKFDSSRDRGQPFPFVLGEGQVIRGWDEGLKGMRVGGIRKLTIPPEMAYGSRGVGGVIPPNATLVFEVELLNVE